MYLLLIVWGLKILFILEGLKISSSKDCSSENFKEYKNFKMNKIYDIEEENLNRRDS